MHTQNLGFYLVAGFLVINLIVGLWFGRKSTTMRDYALANKSYSTGPLVMTYLATIVGGGWIFGKAQDIYVNGIGNLLFIVAGILGMLLRAWLIAPRMLQFRNCLSIGEIFGNLYGREERVLTGILSFFFSTVNVGLQLVCLGFIFKQFFGIDGSLSIIASGLVLGTYCSIGGMRAVVSTDILQFILLISCLLIVSILGIKSVGSLEILIQRLPAEKFLLFKNDSSFYFCMSVFGLFTIFSASMADSPIFDRMLMAPSTYYLRRMQYIGGIGVAIVIGLIAIIGLSASVLFPDIDSSKIILHMTQTLVLDWLQGFVSIGIVAVVFSTGDSYIHSAGIAFSRDIISPLRNMLDPKSLTTELGWAKAGSFVISLVSIILALCYDKLFSMAAPLLSVVYPILLAPLLLSIFGIKPDRKAFWFASSCSIVAYIFCKRFLPPPYEGLYLILPCITNAIVYMIVHIQINGGIMLVKHEGDKVVSTYKWKPFQVKNNF